MTRTLTFKQHYPVDPDRLFDLVSDLDTLDAVSHPWIQFHHLPSGPVRTGQVIDVAISFLGVLPARPYRMCVALCDPATRHMQTREDGVGIYRLVHDLRVDPDGSGARLLDRIEIDAGWKSGLFTVLAWGLYRWRHHLRLRLLKGLVP